MGVARLLITYWRKGKLMFQITAIKSEDNIACKRVIYKASFSISLTILKYILKKICLHTNHTVDTGVILKCKS